MNILILGDVVGPAGREALKLNLPNILKEKNIDFTIVNGENSADDGHGITKEIANMFFNIGVDVITSGNHIWDKNETTDFITKEERLLRPANFAEGSPGNGYGTYNVKGKKYKVGVINLMGIDYLLIIDQVLKTLREAELAIVRSKWNNLPRVLLILILSLESCIVQLLLGKLGL